MYGQVEGVLLRIYLDGVEPSPLLLMPRIGLFYQPWTTMVAVNGLPAFSTTN
jgi:hypothetical protein